MKKIVGLLRLLRFELPLSAGICVIMGQLLALGEFASIYVTLNSFFAIFLISASILVLNDYFDLETDKINAPNRPIPSKLVTPLEALLFSIIILLLGLYLSLITSFSAFITALILAVVGFLYNRIFKKSGLLGNLLVSFSVGMTFIYGGISLGLPFNKMVIFFGIIAALIDLGEEIASDAMDMKGDLLIQSNSIAIKYGRAIALKVSSFIFFIVILLTLLPFLLNWFPIIYLIPIGVMDFSIAYSSLKLLNSKNDEGRIYVRVLYLGATFGLIVFLIMRLVGL